MIDITHKKPTLRKAVAEATIKTSSAGTIEAVLQKRIPKGDVFEFSRAAGLLAIKKTSDVIPDCHPLPVEFSAVRHSVAGNDIRIEVEVHAIYRTGVEVEAMHGASVTALTIYDMLKPIDKGLEITGIRLLSKKGGKSDLGKAGFRNLRVAVIVCSDSVSAGTKKDLSGKAIVEKLADMGLETSQYEVIPDDFTTIQAKAVHLATEKTDLLLLTGGTGLSPRDVTPDAIAPLLDRAIPGIMEAARAYGQERTPFAMLSRGVAGFIHDMLVLTLPGSVNGAVETMEAVFPQLLHVFAVKSGESHDAG